MKIDPRLLEFIQAEQKAGTPNNGIREKLLTRGWSPLIVDQALEFVRTGMNPSVRTKGRILSAKMSKGYAPRRYRRRTGLYPVLFLAIAVVVGYLAFDYFYLHSPEQLLKSMSRRLPAVQSVAYGLDLKVDIPISALSQVVQDAQASAALDGSDMRLRLAIGGQGALDWRNKDQTASRLDSSLRVIGWSDQDLMKLQYRADASRSAFRLNNGYAAKGGPLAPIAGRWVDYDAETAAHGFPGIQALGMTGSPEIGNRLSQLLSELVTDKAVIYAKRLGYLPVNGQDSWRVGLVLDGAILRKVLHESFPTAASGSLLGTVSVTDVEIWINRESYLPERLSFKSVSLLNDGQMESSATLTFSDFNRAVEVDMPQSDLLLRTAIRLIEEGLREPLVPVPPAAPTEEVGEYESEEPAASPEGPEATQPEEESAPPEDENATGLPEGS